MNKKIILILILFFQLICYSQKDKRERLAILDFKVIANETDSKDFRWLELGFAETLTDAFSRIPEFSTIERSQMSKILDEQNQVEHKALQGSVVQGSKNPSAVRTKKILSL